MPPAYMKKTKLYFDSLEVTALREIVAACVEDLEKRSVTVDAKKHAAITQRVVKIASRGISDPDEMRELVVSHFSN